MTRFRYIAVALVALAPIGAQAACSGPWPAPTFAVAVEDPPVAYDFNEDRAALAKIAGKNGMPSLGQAEIPYGITIGRYDLDIVVETDSVRNGPGLCTHLRSAHAVVGLKQLDVVIDRRFGAGSCQRQAVLDHERQHVEIFREAIRYYEPAIERALAAATIPKSVSVADRDAARDAYLRPLTEAVAPIFEAINGRARAGNAQIDIPRTYNEVFEKCPSW